MDEQTTNQSGGSRQEGYSGYGYEGNPFEQMDQDLCKRCHRRRIDRSENPESILCKDCREELIKLKVPPLIIGVSIGVAILVLISIVMIGARYAGMMFGRYSDDVESYLGEDMEDNEDVESDNADSGYTKFSDTDDVKIDITEKIMSETGLVVTGLDNLLEVVEENPDNTTAAVTLVDLAMSYSYYDYAAYTIQNYLADKELADDVIDRLNGYVDKLNKYYDTYDIIDESWAYYSEMLEAIAAMEEADSEEEYEEEYMELIQEFHDEIAEYLGDEDYDQAFLYYQLAGICQDEEERIQHLKDCIALDENYFDAKAQLGVSYRRQGDLDEARAILEGAYAVNKEVYSVIRALATLELVEGNLEKGLTYAESAYDMYSEGTYVADTYVIALLANGQAEEAEALIEEWEEAGYEFEEDLYAFQRGEMTLQEYYIGD